MFISKVYASVYQCDHIHFGFIFFAGILSSFFSFFLLLIAWFVKSLNVYGKEFCLKKTLRHKWFGNGFDNTILQYNSIEWFLSAWPIWAYLCGKIQKIPFCPNTKKNTIECSCFFFHPLEMLARLKHWTICTILSKNMFLGIIDLNP